jgi:hypothetical protein
MTTRHLSVSVTLYGDGAWSLALLETTCVPGQPARTEQLRTVKTDLDHVRRDVGLALQRMVQSEQMRVSMERQERATTP